MDTSLSMLAVTALHKLAIEIERGTASSRCEYENAIVRLDEMKAAVGGWPCAKLQKDKD